ncbi:hypothetical protein FUAX_06700 [Fulvitalea axinellae]|uniref:Uncharacterized protein n=1 Tax=Fulvitalea axinellae TaxID=1182444 RepID=A0AAU9CJS0_9BACT|nr:hypothetical protein FUAX_06700 [Fulvitalea axinellae]
MILIDLILKSETVHKLNHATSLRPHLESHIGINFFISPVEADLMKDHGRLQKANTLLEKGESASTLLQDLNIGTGFALFFSALIFLYKRACFENCGPNTRTNLAQNAFIIF